jgi:two-component system, sensor histidine kinase and response regulator
MFKRLKKILGLNKYKVLVVDDIEENLELLKTNIDLLNDVTVYGCTESKRAEQLLKNIDFSLIVLDIQMPGMDGYELATKLKTGQYNRNENVPLIFVTGIYYSDIDKMKGYNIGSIDYITKPIDNEEFTKKVKKYLSYSYIKGDMNKNIIKQRNMNIKKSVNI